LKKSKKRERSFAGSKESKTVIPVTGFTAKEEENLDREGTITMKRKKDR
jgi:hypothetical protein